MLSTSIHSTHHLLLLHHTQTPSFLFLFLLLFFLLNQTSITNTTTKAIIADFLPHGSSKARAMPFWVLEHHHIFRYYAMPKIFHRHSKKEESHRKWWSKAPKWLKSWCLTRSKSLQQGFRWWWVKARTQPPQLFPYEFLWKFIRI